MGGWFELLIVLAFAVGYGVIEWQCRRLDRKRDEQRRADARRD